MSKHSTGMMIGALAGTSLAAAYLLAKRKRSEFDLKDKVVLITGGSRGLGLVLARTLAAEGCRLALCARDPGELERAQADLAQEGAEAVTFECDATDQDAVQELIGDVLHHYGKIDVLINNAGVISVGPLALQTKKDLKKALKIHFWAPYYASMAVLPSMKEQGGGRIVNIASIGGKIAVPHLAPYCASKFALVGLSSAMRSELAKDGIAVTTACPGLMRTGSHINALFKGQNEKEYLLFSLMASLPLSSVSAESAAKQIVKAMCRGDAELIISPQAKLAAKLTALAPEFVSEIMMLADRFLPAADGDTQSIPGLESRDLTPSFLTTMGDAASVRNNELRPGETLS